MTKENRAVEKGDLIASDEYAKNRKQFRKKLANEGIETGTHYKPVHHMSYYKNKKPLPITEKISNEIVTIPIHPNLTDNQLSKIVHFVNKFS